MDLQLLRKGYRLFYDTPRTKVNFQIPVAQCVYDQCGAVVARKISINHDIQGRDDCFGIFRTVMRMSASIISYVGNPDFGPGNALLAPATIGAIPTLPDSRLTLYFNGEPRRGVESRSQNGSYPLTDACNETHGEIGNVQYERYAFDDDCKYGPNLTFNITVAADQSLTPANIGANITALGGFFLPVLADTVACPTLDAAVEAIWAPLATAQMTLALGVYETA